MVGLDDLKKKSKEAVDKTKDVTEEAGGAAKKTGEKAKDTVTK